MRQIDVDELFTVIERAQQMGIIVPSAEGPERPFTFSHELVRQTLLASISAPRRQRLHAGVADAIERLYPGAVNERAGQIADHLLKAGSFADGHGLVTLVDAGRQGRTWAAALFAGRRKSPRPKTWQPQVPILARSPQAAPPARGGPQARPVGCSADPG